MDNDYYREKRYWHTLLTTVAVGIVLAVSLVDGAAALRGWWKLDDGVFGLLTVHVIAIIVESIIIGSARAMKRDMSGYCPKCGKSHDC